MTIKLFCSAVIRVISGVLLTGILLFLPAGTVQYPNGWLLMGVLFVPMLVTGIILMIRNPALLRKRLNTTERQDAQKLVIKLSGLLFAAGFICAGLDFRFQWLPLPKTGSYIAAAVCLLAYLLYAEVLRENAYLSRTIEVQEGQKVIDTGLYAVVRHPLYSATVLLFLAMPLVLGSIVSFIVFLFYPLLIAKRIKNEEEVLETALDGYAEYKKRVRYRLLPFIW